MASIKIINRFDESPLFPEDESFLNDNSQLTEQDLTALVGGLGADTTAKEPKTEGKPVTKDSSEEEGDGSAEENGTLSGRYCGRVGL